MDTYPTAPQPQPEQSPLARARRAAGPVAVGAAALGKYALPLIKLAKFGPTIVSMVISVALMATIFGAPYGIGLIALIAIHESGHLLFARHEGIRTGLPIFLGPFGAVIGLKQPPKDVRQEAVIAIGGPVVGTMGAIVALILSGAAPAGTYTHNLLLALAYVGFLINLFNLVPFSPLDGGRVASALSPWVNLVGLGVILLLIAGPVATGHSFNPFLLFILVIGGISTLQRFKRRGANPEYERIPGRTRMWIAVAYVAMLAITAVAMTETHAALLSAQVASTIQ
ncbi:MAG TPA: site-2 protease family protein [Candidatus Angelobacter sp.]|nr:site-2 protease family protein [Candidatus Angelobacter sp.]